MDSDKDVRTFSLSASSEGNSYFMHKDDYEVYEQYIDAAFKDDTVHSIAVTGNYGVGKSSILRQYARKKNKNFLFVSGCSFFCENTEDTNQLENAVLGQLLAGSHRTFGNGFLRNIPLALANVLFGGTGFFLIGTILLLTLAPKLGPYLRELGLYNSTLSYYIHVVCFAGLAVFACVDAACVFARSHQLLQIKSLSVELGDFKIGAEAREDSILLNKKYELLLALNETAKLFDYTVVFEDMDRLKAAQCLSLFSKLWELNVLCNLRRRKKTPLRFIYVIHDGLLSEVDAEKCPDNLIQHKYFDYILPIVPSMSDKDAYIAARKLFFPEIPDKQQKGSQQVESNVSVQSTHRGEGQSESRKEDGTPVDTPLPFDDAGFEEVLVSITHYLSDYRLLRNIANEYYVFKSIAEKRHLFEKRLIDTQKLLAFIVYKNLMPEDYKLIREGKSVVFQTPNTSATLHEAIKVLKANHWLTAECLRLLGYDYDSIKRRVSCLLQAQPDKIQENGIVKKELLFQHFDVFCSCLLETKHTPEQVKDAINGVEYSFLYAFFFCSSNNKILPRVLEKLTAPLDSPCKEICSDSALQFIGNSIKEAPIKVAFQAVLYMVRVNCDRLAEFIPASGSSFVFTDAYWWKLFTQIENDNDLSQLKQISNKHRDCLEAWIKRSTAAANCSDSSQFSHAVRKYLEKHQITIKP